MYMMGTFGTAEQHRNSIDDRATSSPNSHICTDLGPSFGFVVNIFLNFCIGVTIMCILLHITKCEKIFSDALSSLPSNTCERQSDLDANLLK